MQKEPLTEEEFNNQIYLFLSFMAAGFVFVALFAYIWSNIGYRGAVRKYLEACWECDAESVLNLIPDSITSDPAALWDGCESRSELKKELSTYLIQRKVDLQEEYGQNMDYAYKIQVVREVEDPDTEFIKAAAEIIEKEQEIQQIYELTMQITIYGMDSDGDYPVMDGTMFAVKVNGKWYILSRKALY